MNHAKLLATLAGLLLCLSAALNARAADIEKDGIWTLSTSGDCRFLLAQPSLDHYVVLDSATLEQVSPTIGLENVQAATLSDDGGRLAFSDDHAKLRIFDTRSAKLILSTVIPVPLQPKTSGFLNVHFLRYSHDGQEIVVVTDEVLVIMNATTGKEITRINSPEIWSFKFKWAQLTPDKGQLLAYYGFDRAPSLWDTHTGKLLRTFDDPAGREVTTNSICLSPDGKLIATGEDVLDKATKIPGYLARVRECQSGRIVLESNFDYAVRALAFSPDGKQFAAADRMVRVFDASAGKQMTKSLGNGMGWDDKVRGVAFSPDGKYVMSGAPDGFVMAWDVRTQQLVLKIRDAERITFAGFAGAGDVLIAGEDSGPGPDPTRAMYAWKLSK